MRTTLIALAAAVLVAACTPMPATDAPSSNPGQSSADLNPAACVAQGGEIRRVGRLQREACIILYTDADKPCTDNSQCQGDCRAEDMAPKPGPVTGRCQADSSNFGCHADVVNGQVTAGICID